MKRQKLILVGLLVVAFVAYFMMRPVREKACPLTTENLNDDPDFARHCTETGRVVKDGKCTCPE
jgi:lipopolysaccharide export system protein LptC